MPIALREAASHENEARAKSNDGAVPSARALEQLKEGRLAAPSSAKARQRVARFYTDTHQREKLDALMREVKPDASHGG